MCINMMRIYLQLFERRSSQSKGKERRLLKLLNEKVMSDEETDSDEANSFVKRSPPWRSHKLDRLFKALDERYDLKNQTSLKRN